MEKIKNRRQQRMHRKVICRKILYIIFVLYLLVLFKIILFKYFSPINTLKIIFSGGENGFRSLNLKPFTIFADFGEIMQSGQILRGIANTFGNVCVFAPLGYFLPLLFRSFHKTHRVLLAALGLSLFFEAAQYFCYLGTADVDDVMLNFVGALIGKLFYDFINYYTKDDYLKYKITIVLSVLCFMCAFFVARDQFGSILGISNHKTTYEGKENIPDRDCDYSGTYLEIAEGVLRYYTGYVAESNHEKELMTVKECKVTVNTQYVSMNIEEKKRESIIRYETMNRKEVDEVEPYWGIFVWLDEDDNADTILFTNKIEDNADVSVESSDGNKTSAGKENSTEEKGNAEGKDSSEDSIWGEITEMTDDGFVLNMGISMETEDGSIATMGVGENANPVDIKLSDHVVYSKMIVHNQLGTDVDHEDAEKEDMKIGQSVELKGYMEDGRFVAEEVEIKV